MQSIEDQGTVIKNQVEDRVLQGQESDELVAWSISQQTEHTKQKNK